mgnify:FL=1
MPSGERENTSTVYAVGEDQTKVLFSWEILAKLRGTAADEAKEYIKKRDASKCWHCKAEVVNVHTDLEFHHIDRNNKNNRRWNLRLMHDRCNSSVYHREQKGRPSIPVRVRERKIADEAQPMPDATTYEGATHQGKTHPFRVWVIKQIQEGWKGYVEVQKKCEADIALDLEKELKEAAEPLKYATMVDAGAERSKIAVQTAYNWIRPMKNKVNGFIYLRDMPQGKLLDFKNPAYHKMSPEDIYAKHPSIDRD